MSYNMYDKNYGSGFTPENDNRPPEDRPCDPQPASGEYRYSYGFQPADGSPYQAPPVSPPQPNRKKKSATPRAAKVIAAVLACLLIGGAAGAGGAYLMFGALNSSAASDGTAVSTEGGTDRPTLQVSDRADGASVAQVAAGNAMTPSQIYDAYSDSVVSIEVQTANGIGAGTGFLISEDGYILTCYHVVEGYQAISCTFIDSTSYEAAYVGGDEDADLAIIKIESADGSSFKPVVLGDSGQLTVGSTVTAIGNALGTFANTLTSGTVSGLDRALTMSDGKVMNVLQTDCTVNSGNSGGPLFNEYGEVIGVVNAKYSSSGYSSAATVEGIGFAIPINDALAISDDLIAHGYITGKPHLGISVATVSSITAQQYSNMVVGAYVRSVEEGSCAETAGIQVGDIITQVNNQDITTYEELIDAKNALRAGDEMLLTVFREGTYLTITVTLDEEVPQSAAGSADDGQSSQNGNEYSHGYNNPYGYYSPFGGNDPYSFFFGQGGW